MLDKMFDSGITGGIVALIAISITFLIFKIMKKTIKEKSFFIVFGILMTILWIGLKTFPIDFNSRDNAKLISKNIEYNIVIKNDYIDINGYKLSANDFKLISELFKIDMNQLLTYDFYGMIQDKPITPIPIMKSSILKSDKPLYHSIFINFEKYFQPILIDNIKIERNMSSELVRKYLGEQYFKPIMNKDKYSNYKYETETRKIIFGFTDNKLIDMEIFLIKDTMKYLKQ